MSISSHKTGLIRNDDTSKNNRTSLVDLRSVTINSNLPHRERLEDYMNQIKNPYTYMVGDVRVNLIFAQNGPSIKDALNLYLSSLKNHT